MKLNINKQIKNWINSIQLSESLSFHHEFVLNKQKGK